MTNILLVVVCLVIGVLLQRVLPPTTPRVLAGVVLQVALPAVTLSILHELPWTEGGLAPWILPASMAWLAFGFSAALVAVSSRIWRWSPRTSGALLLTVGLCNTSFVGFPLLSALLGEKSLGVGIIVDQFGSFLVLSTLGVWAATAHARSETGAPFRLVPVLRKVVTFPPFVALVIALVTRPLAYPAFVKGVLDKLGALLVPLALLQVGYQLRLDLAALRRHRMTLAWGLFVRLVLTPAALTLGVLTCTRVRGEVAMVTILEGAMSPMITGAILAVEHDLEPELANLMIGVGIPLSLLTVPAWWWLLRPLLGYA